MAFQKNLMGEYIVVNFSVKVIYCAELASNTLAMLWLRATGEPSQRLRMQKTTVWSAYTYRGRISSGFRTTKLRKLSISKSKTQRNTSLSPATNIGSQDVMLIYTDL